MLHFHPIFKCSCLIPLYLSIINPKVHSVKSVKWGRKIPEASPHAASEAVSPRSVSLTLPNRCCFLRGCLCLLTLGAFQRFQGDRAVSPFFFLEFSPVDRALPWFRIEETKRIAVRWFKEIKEEEMGCKSSQRVGKLVTGTNKGEERERRRWGQSVRYWKKHFHPLTEWAK